MEELEICKVYKTMPLRQLSKLSSISEPKLKRILLNNGMSLKQKGGQRQYSLNENAFDTITDESAYWLGMMVTDGSITTKSPIPHYVNLSLKEKDENHVKSFGLFLGSNQPVKTRKNGKNKDGKLLKQSYLSISSTKLAYKLIEYGIVPNKTETAHAPQAVKNNRDFWRGVVDGDGWLTITTDRQLPCIGLCGTKTLVGQFQEYVKTITETDATPYKSKTSEINWKYQFAGQPAQTMITHLYKDASIALPRKMERAKFWLNNPYTPKTPTWKITVADYPEVALQWHLTKNTMSPTTVAYGSTKKFWWICYQSHEWQASPNNRINKKSKCPICEGRRPKQKSFLP